VIISFSLVLLVTLSGTAASYLYDDDAPFAARLCGGACIGIAALGLVGFVFASFLGLTTVAIVVTALVVGVLPLALIIASERWIQINKDLDLVAKKSRRALSNPTLPQFGYFVFYLVMGVVLWRVFQRAMIQEPEGIFTGVINNFGDLPFHLSVISGFAFGNNFPPQDPTYAGVHFTYPFLTDFISAIFVRCGADFRQSMFLENFVVCIAFVGLMHRWALEMVRDRLAAVITPLLVLLNGGFGWIYLQNIAAEKSNEGLAAILQALPSSFTIIPNSTWRWGNAMSTLLVPQRGFLLGLPLAVIVFTQWWKSTGETSEQTGETGKGEGTKGKKTESKQKKLKQSEQSQVSVSQRERTPLSRFPLTLTPSVRRMIAAGIVAGLLPLVHAHSFVVVMGVAACIALLQWRWREWITFAVVASIIALPQMWWSTHNSAVDAKKFFEWQLGWDHGQENIVWFWLKNTGLFIPLTVAAILWRQGKEALIPRRLLIFFLPFTLCFIVPNVLKMAPWIWDNIKVLFYWWLASAPLVAALIARLWRKGPLQKALALSLFACVTLAGALDVAVIVLRSNQYGVFDAGGIQFAELIKNETPPNAVVIHAPVHNHPVFLTGRRSLMGYPGHVWTHGLEFGPREAEIKRVYAGTPDATSILQKYNVDYAVLGPLEKNVLAPNVPFFSRFQLVGDVGGYRLYKITKP
jgi:hypothetical protein